MSRKPTDATLRNVRASHRRDSAVQGKVSALTRRVSTLERQVRRLIAKSACVLLVLWAAPAWAQVLPMGVPDLCAPVADRTVVASGQSVTWSGSVRVSCAEVRGSLTVSSNATVTADTILVYPGGRLQIGSESAPAVGVRIMIADKAIDLARDPEQYGTGLICFGTCALHGTPKTSFARAASGQLAGDIAVTLREVPVNWQVGDRLAFPDSEHFNPAAGVSYAPKWEERTIASIAGASVTVNAPLSFAHPGTSDGLLAPHVVNLTRSITIQSQNPTGTRGHVIAIGRAEVDIRYVAFRMLGRTTVEPLDSTVMASTGPTKLGANQIGRYPIHMHHLVGPTVSPVNGYQFTLVGNAVDGGAVEHLFKWGIAIHNSHYGLVSDNAVYNVSGGGIVGEDGSETENLVTRNIVVRVFSPFNNDRGDGRLEQSDFAFEGSAFWFRGPFNRITNNVAADAYAYGYKLFFYLSNPIKTPAFKGADPAVEGVLRPIAGSPLVEFSGNENYGGMGSGLTIWFLCANSNSSAPSCGRSTVLNHKDWHHAGLGVWCYDCAFLTFDGWVARGDPKILGWAENYDRSILFGDYYARDIVLKNLDIRDVETGVVSPTYTEGTFTLQDSTIKAIHGFLHWGVAAPGNAPGGPWRPRTMTISNVKFEPATPSGPVQPTSIEAEYRVWGMGQNFIISDTTRVIAFNGVAGDDFDYFTPQQAPGFVVPQTNGTNIGSPEAGLTNAQNWAKYMVAMSGAVAPCTTTRPGIVGFACAASAPIPQPVNCVVSAWSPWSEWAPISATQEQRTRTRTVITAPSNGGSACPPLTETEVRSVTAPQDPCVVSPLTLTINQQNGWPSSASGSQLRWSTNRPATVTFNPLASPWRVTATDANGCSATVMKR